MGRHTETKNSSSDDAAPLVYIIVLNYNGLHHLEYCLPSLLAAEYPNYRVVVVDNASADDSVAHVRSTYPNVELLASPHNAGWSGGNNLGIRHALARGAAYIALANNDIRVDPRWIQEGVKACQEDERIGLVGYRILTSQRDFAEAMAQWDAPQIRQVNANPGCALLVRSKLFEGIGLIDETFFAYCEEIDLAYRAARAGYTSVEINVPVWHARGGTFGTIPLRSGYLAMQSQIHFA
ncbi:MAG: hypothetical protein A2Y73_08450, partial [Chloroflexi bacterium RBG_13_56_8]